MKDFIKQIIFFLIFSIILTISICFCNKYFVLSPMYFGINSQLSKEIDTVCFGDSHTACSFNPDVIEGGMNQGIPGENLFYNYYKIKYFIENNPQVENVIVSYSYHSLSMKNESNRFCKGRLNTFYMILDREGKKISREYWQGGYINNFLIYDLGLPLNAFDIYNTLKNSKEEKKFPFWGRHYDSKTSKVRLKRMTNKAIKRHYYGSKNKLFRHSDLMEIYVNKIAELCQLKNKKLIFINTPIHKNYKKQVPHVFKVRHKRVIEEVISNYPKTEFYDYTSFPLENYQYGDGDHLNYYGALEFSNELNRILDKKVIDLTSKLKHIQ